MNELHPTAFAWVALAYALGCIQTGYYLVRLRTGRDLRTLGSGSTGARNAGRVLGRGGFALTLAGDMFKGALAVGFALAFSTPGVAASAALAVTVGHIWPVQLGFSGGRGIAVTLGAIAALEPALLLVPAAAIAAGRALGGSFTRSGLVGFAVLPVVAGLLRVPPASTIALALTSLIILAAHRAHLAAWLQSRRGDGE